MARSAKTNHVMSLVGEKDKEISPKKDDKENKPVLKESSPIKMFNPALLAIEEEQRSNPETTYIPRQHEMEEYGARAEEEEKAYTDRPKIPPKQEKERAEKTEQQSEKEASAAEEPQEGSAEDKRKNAITAIVPELINQELEAIAVRFHIAPTDSNLWQLTKAALETIRPEFSRSTEEYEEKCGRLRQRVILEMTKAAIRISKGSRK